MNTALKRPVVLTVNDEPNVLELLTVFLEREDYKVITAESGSRALELALIVEPDIIISDVVMPLMDGFELCQRLKRDARTASVPVLLMSALRTEEKDSLDGLVAGADDYLQIPFRRQELLVKVARLAERHRVERHYREIVEESADIIYTGDMDGTITSINEAGARFFGRPASELVGAPLSELIGTEEAAGNISEIQQPTSDEPLRRLHHLRDASGVARYLEAIITPVRDGQGDAVGVRAVVRDITERMTVEEAMRESEERYRALVEQSSDGIFLADIETKRILEANPAYCSLLGYTPEEILKLTLYDVAAASAETIDENIGKVLTAGYHFIGERQHLRRDGSPVDVEISVNSVSFGGKQALCTVVRDITERKRAEEALRENEKRYRDLFENANDLIYTHDMAGNFTSLNKTGERITGYTRDEALRMNIAQVVAPEHIEKARGMIALKTNEDVSTVYELDINARGGRRVSLEVSTRLIYQDGKAVGVQGIGRDVTERKRADEALAQQVKREALINRISGAVRHSLNPAEIFRSAVEELGRHLNVDRCSLFKFDIDAGLVRYVAEYTAPGLPPATLNYDLSQFADVIAGVREHGVLTFDDAATDERLNEVYNGVLRARGIRSLMYVAIKVGDELPAVFAISTIRSLRHWSEEDIALARAAADQTGIAIRHAELYQKAEATSSREALINRLSLAIRASLSLPEVLSTATRELGLALNASRVHLHLYDPSRERSPVEHEYVAPNSSSIRHVDVSYNDPIGQRLMYSTQPVVINDARQFSSGPTELNSYVRVRAELVGVRSKIDCPVIVNGRFRGALCIHQTDRVRHWTEDEVALVEAVAGQLATGIAQAELFEMMRRAKKEWEATFNSMSDGIFIFDHEGQLIRVNRTGAAMEDTWPHLLMGRRCCDILRASETDETCIVERSIREERSVTLEVTPERYNRPLLVTVEPVIERESNTVGAVCTARDLSELRKVEAVARERQSLLTNVLESVRDPIFAVDTRGHFLWLNTASTEISGYRSEDLIGHLYLEVIHPADHEMARENFENALRGEPCSYEARYLTRDGEVRDALYYNAPLVVEGRTTGVLGIARDITEHKQHQRRAAQADKLRALGQLASGVAHDFNNALAAILGRAQLMRRQVHAEALVRNLDIIQTAAEDAAATVRRIQTFARQSQEKEFELLDAGSLLHDAMEITRTRWENEARMRGLHYDVELLAEPANFTLGNASELREVFVNLIVNAVDAMPAGGHLAISCAREGERLRLRFTDTGMGIPEDVRERIFEPFYTTKGAHGTGLGLAVSYGIIERHEGMISVESEVGRGTTFEIDLPAAAEHTQATVDAGEDMAEVPSLSVLVIDDEDFVRDTLAEMLSILNHRVVTANGGPQALEALAAEHFDLVFTDLSMPEMDGWEVAREIRRRWPSTSIILVTGYGKATVPAPGEKDLIDSLIGKPFDFTQVTETIAAVTQNALTR
ncbi:MAG TPA: PAS domain S-box protein [Pyrinomonadaceae bacterium]|jgi:PAS domain S-box-containing protein|nr:PAS domain S-box protein [Pyrinomonadaceae bacterium]